MKPNPNVAQSLANAVHQAQLRSVVAAIQSIMQQLGVPNIDGLSVEAWVEQRAHQELQTVLIAMEDRDPAAAAMVQAHLDEMKKKASGDSSEQK